MAIIIVAGKGGVQSSQYIVIDGTIGADSAAHDVDDNDVCCLLHLLSEHYDYGAPYQDNALIW